MYAVEVKIININKTEIVKKHVSICYGNSKNTSET
jgi:hypothetical protein